VGDIDLKVISAPENSNKFQKPGFGRKKSVEGRGNTWANGTGHTSKVLKEHMSCLEILR
jgi:hypothetical protein